VKEFDEMNKIIQAAAAAAAESTKRAAVNTPGKWVKVDVSILNPIVMIPRKNATDEYV
jgi:hypothetical protein